MKRILVILLCLVSFYCIDIHAQKLGFIGGPSMSYGLVATKDKDATFGIIPNAGCHVGMLFEMDITNRWGFDLAAMYELRSMTWNLGYNNDSISNTFNRMVGYLNVPFHFYVNFPVQNKYVLSLFAGPVFACGLHGEDWAYENTELRKPVTYEKENMFGKKEGRIARCEIAAELGLALKWRGLQGRLSYQHGFNNDNINEYRFTLPMTDKKPYFTQGTVKLSVAYVFDLRR